MDWSILHMSIISFLLHLYAEPTFPRNLVDNVVEYMTKFVQELFLPSLQKDILNVIENSETKNEMKIKIEQSFEQHSRVFENIKNEDQRFDFFKEVGFIQSSDFKIDSDYSETFTESGFIFEKQEKCGVSVPLAHSLKYFLEIPKMFSSIKNYMKILFCDSEVLSNIIQGQFYAKKFTFSSNTECVLPISIYFDEIECGNALGSHTGINKFGIVYAKIVILPPNISAQLNSIIFSIIIRAEHMKACKNKKIFQGLVNELKELYEKGIVISLEENKSMLVKF
ncbi:hypothetical protein TKK_0008110 [Trichogramma kaykai]